MTAEQYDDEPLGAIEWTLKLAELHNDQPWQGDRRATPGAQ